MNGIKVDPDIKMDVDAGTPSGSGYMDDDFFEDTGEMTLPKPDEACEVWLTRIPDWLYDAVSKWEDLAEGSDGDQIQLGEVYAFNTTSGIDKTKPMRVFLNDRWRQKAKLPTAFQLDPAQTSDNMLSNTYVFTEKDLPGYRPSAFSLGARNYPSSNSAIQDPKARIQKRGKYRKAIPKQTALLGHATRQYTANPLDTREYKDFSAARIKQAIQGSHMHTVITKDTDVTNYNSLQQRFASFIKPPPRTKPQQNKAARISREDLIDILHNCFDEFQYWPMKALKARTKQPETFLKEVLADIAQLVKSGPFASTWQRAPMFSQGRDMSNQQQQAAPEGGAMEEEDEEEMEDVV